MGVKGPAPFPDVEYIISLVLSFFLYETEMNWMICKVFLITVSGFKIGVRLAYFVTQLVPHSISLMMCSTLPLSC